MKTTQNNAHNVTLGVLFCDCVYLMRFKMSEKIKFKEAEPLLCMYCKRLRTNHVSQNCQIYKKIGHRWTGISWPLAVQFVLLFILKWTEMNGVVDARFSSVHNYNRMILFGSVFFGFCFSWLHIILSPSVCVSACDMRCCFRFPVADMRTRRNRVRNMRIILGRNVHLTWKHTFYHWHNRYIQYHSIFCSNKQNDRIFITWLHKII